MTGVPLIYVLSRTLFILSTKREFKPLDAAGCSAQVYRQSSDPYLLVRCGLVLLVQQVHLSPHSRSAIRDGEEARIPSPAPKNGSCLTPAAQIRLERKSYTIPSTSAAGLQRKGADGRCDFLDQRAVPSATPVPGNGLLKVPLLFSFAQRV